MAKFVFALQNVYHVKQKLEEKERNLYSQEIARLHMEEDKLKSIQDKRESCECEYRELLVQALEIEKIVEKESALQLYKTFVDSQIRCVEKQHGVVEIARTRLNAAMVERKTYEKLREKAFEEFKLEENKVEQKANDELVSYRYGNMSHS